MDSSKNKTYSKSESNISSKASPKSHLIKKNIKSYNEKSNNLNRNMFEFIFIIGKGGFGKVWRVKEKKTKELYALKEMSKTKIIDKKSEKSINGEREFLSYLHHPFIVNMHYAFQDHDNLYLVMDLLTGGDLRYHCSRYRSFSEEQTRFFLACIIHSLSYIHKNKVIHRDIKPENLVLDDKGYVHITDFGIAKINMPDNSSETSGTPGYMCPEVMNRKNHSFPADYFSIGVIGYEFMMGRRPYRGRGRKEIKEQMISYEAKIEESEMKDGWSMESIDFINGLLKRKENKRLGSKKGVKELKEHPWLKYYPWKELSNKSLPAPFIPEPIDNFDKKYCESLDEISEETQLRYEEIMLCTHFNTAFDEFYFNKDEAKRDDGFKEENESIKSEEEEKEENSEDENTNSKEQDINKENNTQKIESETKNEQNIKLSSKEKEKESEEKKNKLIEIINEDIDHEKSGSKDDMDNSFIKETMNGENSCSLFTYNNTNNISNQLFNFENDNFFDNFNLTRSKTIKFKERPKLDLLHLNSQGDSATSRIFHESINQFSRLNSISSINSSITNISNYEIQKVSTFKEKPKLGSLPLMSSNSIRSKNRNNPYGFIRSKTLNLSKNNETKKNNKDEINKWLMRI